MQISYLYGLVGRKEMTMKKFTLILVSLLMMLCMFGCANNETPLENNGTTLDVSEPADAKDDAFTRVISETEVKEDVSRGVYSPGVLSSNDLSFSDFDFLEDWMYTGIPEDVYYPYASYMPGEWKYRLYYQYDADASGYTSVFNEIGFADIDIDFDNAVFYINLHPKFGNDGYETWEAEDSGYSTFAGGFEGDGVKLIDQEEELILYIYSYFAYEGREYIYATMYISEEDYAMTVFTRGQN